MTARKMRPWLNVSLCLDANAARESALTGLTGAKVYPFTRAHVYARAYAHSMTYLKGRQSRQLPVCRGRGLASAGCIPRDPLAKNSQVFFLRYIFAAQPILAGERRALSLILRRFLARVVSQSPFNFSVGQCA